MKEWKSKISVEVSGTLLRLIDRRNQLTHDSDYRNPTMKEAVEYFYSLRQLAEILIIVR